MLIAALLALLTTQPQTPPSLPASSPKSAQPADDILFLLLFSEMGSQVAQAGLGLQIFLPQPLKYLRSQACAPGSTNVLLLTLAQIT